MIIGIDLHGIHLIKSGNHLQSVNMQAKLLTRRLEA